MRLPAGCQLLIVIIVFTKPSLYYDAFFLQCSGDIIPGRDVTWDAVMERAQPHDCIPVLSNDPLYILYTSGTTGDPKVLKIL